MSYPKWVLQHLSAGRLLELYLEEKKKTNKQKKK